MLDVPCGGGSAALGAARRFCRAVAVDAPEALERVRRRAEAEGLELTVAEGGASELPFPDGCFDAVLSAADAMSAPGPDGAAAELLRVCRPGGRIGLVAWTPDGYPGRLWGRRRPPARGCSATCSPRCWAARPRSCAAPLLVGPAGLCAERLAAWAEAGARRIFVWALGDEPAQLERFRERVAGSA